VTKTKKEVAQQKREHAEKEKIRKERREEQERNVARKKAEKGATGKQVAFEGAEACGGRRRGRR
jgi:ribosome biogenesis protein SSF1/2